MSILMSATQPQHPRKSMGKPLQNLGKLWDNCYMGPINTSSRSTLPAVRRFDAQLVGRDEHGVRIAVEFNATRPRSRLPLRAGYEPSGYRVEYLFGFTADGNDIEPLPIAATLMRREGIKPSELNRFAWTRWSPLAEAHARSAVTFTLQRQSAVVDSERTIGRRLRIVKGRPGRGGHKPDHYPRIAARYQALARQGCRNPVKRISEEEFKSRATVAGWIREARRRNLLPPARKGRAG